jgi:transposase
MTANNADKKPEAAKPTNKKRPNPAAKKQVAGKKAKKAEPMSSKADLIRKVAGVLKAKGEVVRPKDIVEILKKEGVDVAPAQVSMTLKAAGYRPLRKRRKGKKTAEGAATATKAAKSSGVSLDDLLAAKKAVAALGGTAKALEAIQALKRLEG